MRFLVGGDEFSGRALLTDAGRARGLQGVALNPQTVLAFVWPHDRTRTFHMGRVAYPIDLVFIGGDGHVRHAIANAQPRTGDRWSAPAAVVLESRGGELSRVVRLGERVTSFAEGIVRGGVLQPKDQSRMIAEIVDTPAFMHAVIEGLVRAVVAGQLALPWRADTNNAGRTESAVITRPVLELWFKALPVSEPVEALAAALAPEGLAVIAELLLAAGIAQSARQSPQGLVITRAKPT